MLQAGSLAVQANGQQVWKVTGDQDIDLKTRLVVGYPGSWRFAQILLPAQTSTISFVATKGPGQLGDIALDSVGFSDNVEKRCKCSKNGCLNR